MLKDLLYLVIFLLMYIFSLFVYPSSSSAAVTLSLGEGVGFRGSTCCSPLYQSNNKIVLSLDNPDDRIKTIQITIDDVGDYLSISGYEVDPTRAGAFSCIVNEVGGDAYIYMSASPGVYIEKDNGPILTLYYDVDASAPTVPPPGESCRDLTITEEWVWDEFSHIVTGVVTEPGEFCFYKCGVDLHCDDGVYCNGQEECFGNSWCTSYGYCVGGSEEGNSCQDDEDCNGGTCDKNPCQPLLCEEVSGCYCDANWQCDDTLWCNGMEACVEGECVDDTPPCSDDGDPCTDDCDEDSESCTYVCNAVGPWDPCCSSDECVSDDICSEDVTLTVGDGSGGPGESGRPVEVSLYNPNDEVKWIGVTICDTGDYLHYVNIPANCEVSERAQAYICDENSEVPGATCAVDNDCLPNFLGLCEGGFCNGDSENPGAPCGDDDDCPPNEKGKCLTEYGCTCEESDGCVACGIVDIQGLPPIAQGDGTVFTIFYDVKSEIPFGQCRDLVIDRDNVQVADAALLELEVMPVDGEFCFDDCVSNGECDDGNECTDDICSGGECSNPPLSQGCDDGNPCTENDSCNGDGECIGTDPCPDDEDYCTGPEYCDAGVCYSTDPSPGDVCDPLTCNEGAELCEGGEVILTVGNGYGSEGGVIDILLENNSDQVSEVHLSVCDVDQRDWLTIDTEDCSTTSRTGGFFCIPSDLGNGCVGIDLWSYFPLDLIDMGSGAIAQLNYSVGEVTVPFENHADLNPGSIEVKDDAAASLWVTPRPGRVYTVGYCFGDLNHDDQVTGADTILYKADYNRTYYLNEPCAVCEGSTYPYSQEEKCRSDADCGEGGNCIMNPTNPCLGDLNCDMQVTGADTIIYKSNYNRTPYLNDPCPPYSPQMDCVY